MMRADENAAGEEDRPATSLGSTFSSLFMGFVLPPACRSVESVSDIF